MIPLSHVFPLVFCYFVVAALTVIPHTHGLRVALWLVVTLLAFRVVASVDISLTDLEERYNNTLLVFSTICIVARTLDWTLLKDPLVRHLRPAEGPRSITMDALDLAFSLRGYGWEWSQGVHIPRETRPTDRRGFMFHVVLSAVTHFFLYNILQAAVRSFALTGTEAARGSIFDDTLPIFVCYLRACIISLSCTFAIYAFLQLFYDACTLVGVLLLGQVPEQWPPAFDAPWRTTSISDFWTRRWHQFFRRMFLVLGGHPLKFILGRTGLVCGAFLTSALLHHVAMASLGGELDTWRTLVGFGMMAPVLLAERAFKRFTGHKVGGFAGWVWTMVWFIVWGNTIIDGFARAGMFRRFPCTKRAALGNDVVGRWVVRFDAWLRDAI